MANPEVRVTPKQNGRGTRTLRLVVYLAIVAGTIAIFFL